MDAIRNDLNYEILCLFRDNTRLAQEDAEDLIVHINQIYENHGYKKAPEGASMALDDIVSDLE